MLQYTEFVDDSLGNPVPGVSLTVRCNGSTADIYADAAGTKPRNPVTVDANSFITFYYDAPGTYTFWFGAIQVKQIDLPPNGSTLSDVVRSTALTGLSLATAVVIAATDSIIAAFGKLQAQITANLASFNTHAGNTANPHAVTKAQVGLGNADNTSDAGKPVSVAQQAALDLKASISSSTGVVQVPAGTTAQRSTALGRSIRFNTDTGFFEGYDGTNWQTLPFMQAGFKNKVRNPKMEIGQRGTSFAAANGYTLDGWKYLFSGGQVVTVSQQADVMAGSEMQNSLRVAVTTANAAPAAGDFSIVEQPIEGYLVRDLLGNPIAIQAQVRSPKTGTHCVALRNSGTDRSYIFTYNVTAANTWQVVTLALPGGLISAGTWNWLNGLGVRVAFVLACGSTYQAAAGSWQTGNFVATAAQVNCLDTVGNIFAITGVQMEKSSASTTFEHRDPASELIFNQRYLPAYTSVGATDDAAWGTTTTTSGGIVDYQFLVEPRVAPTGIVVNNLANFSATTFSVSTVATAITFNSSGKRMCRINVTGTGTPYAGGQPFILYGNAAGAQILFTGAEL